MPRGADNTIYGLGVKRGMYVGPVSLSLPLLWGSGSRASGVQHVGVAVRCCIVGAGTLRSELQEVECIDT